MPATHESEQSRELAELQEWYVDGLRPKLTRAAGSGRVEPAAAAELDRCLCELLGLPEAQAGQREPPRADALDASYHPYSLAQQEGAQ
jgi:hypothetical protein